MAKFFFFFWSQCCCWFRKGWVSPAFYFPVKLQSGDTVVRCLGGVIPSRLQETAVEVCVWEINCFLHQLENGWFWEYQNLMLGPEYNLWDALKSEPTWCHILFCSFCFSDLTGAQDGSVRMFEWGHSQQIICFRSPGNSRVTRIRFNHQGNKVAKSYL